MWPHPPAPGWYPDPRGIPGQAYWDGQQWQFPPAPPKKSPLKILALVCGAIFVAVAFTLVSPLGQKALNKSKSTQDADQSSQSTAPAAPQQRSEVKLNQEGRDGNLAFVVTAVDTAQQTVNVHLTVKNVGNRPTVFWTDNQRLWIGDRWFVPDKAAAAKAGTSSVKLDPGKSATVVVPFGVPAGNTAVDSIELHDAAVSAGISVLPRP
jgi:archaellum component FlaG (FlaF/FlaG flagellin family)